jgi:hypothetical protein
VAEREIEIRIGTLFKLNDEEKIQLVVGLGENNYFFSAYLFKTEEGKNWFFNSGTAYKDRFGEIVGQMSIEEVLNARQEGDKHVGLDHTPEGILKDLILESEKGSRVLK